MKIAHIITSIALLLVAFSCTEINNVIVAGDKPIIEAYLAPNSPVNMKVFTEIPYLENDTSFSEPITGLDIVITGSDGSSYPLTDEGGGNYKSIENLGSNTIEYSMSFEYNGRTIAASTLIPPAPTAFSADTLVIERSALDLSGGFIERPPGAFSESQTPITFTWDNPDNVYHFLAAEYLEATLDPVVVFPTNTDGFTRPPQRFNNEPILGEGNTLRPQQFEYFGTYAVILYRLNPDYALLYENSGTSSQNIATPVSTISNGLGIFTGVHADTLYLEVARL